MYIFENGFFPEQHNFLRYVLVSVCWSLPHDGALNGGTCWIVFCTVFLVDNKMRELPVKLIKTPSQKKAGRGSNNSGWVLSFPWSHASCSSPPPCLQAESDQRGPHPVAPPPRHYLLMVIFKVPTFLEQATLLLVWFLTICRAIIFVSLMLSPIKIGRLEPPFSLISDFWWFFLNVTGFASKIQ